MSQKTPILFFIVFPRRNVMTDEEMLVASIGFSASESSRRFEDPFTLKFCGGGYPFKLGGIQNV